MCGNIGEYWEILNSWNLGKNSRIQLFWSGENQIIFFSILARNKRKKNKKKKLKNVQKQKKNETLLFPSRFSFSITNKL